MSKKIIFDRTTDNGFRYQLRKAVNKFIIVKFNTRLSEADFFETLQEFSDEAKAKEAFEKLL